MAYHITSENIQTPLDWLTSEPWCMIADYSDSHDYGYCDALYRVIVGDSTIEELNTEWNTKFRSMKQIKREYASKFPKVLAQAFKGMAEDIESEELIIDYDI